MISACFSFFRTVQMIATLLPTRVRLTIYLWIIVVGKEGSSAAKLPLGPVEHCHLLSVSQFSLRQEIRGAFFEPSTTTARCYSLGLMLVQQLNNKVTPLESSIEIYTMEQQQETRKRIIMPVKRFLTNVLQCTCTHGQWCSMFYQRVRVRK